MHVLQVNKFLFGKGGAETVMFQTADLLREHGHTVGYFAMQDERNVQAAESGHFPRGRYYDGDRPVLARDRDAAASIYSFEARRSLGRLLRERTPDVAHLHNIYHQLTLSIVEELASRRVPTVLTAHDYKPVCPNYLAYTQGAPCHRCVGSHPWHAVVHRCVKGSRAASMVAVTEALLVRARRLYGMVDAFVSPSQHLARMMTQGGIPSERIKVIPNFIAADRFRDAPPASRRERPAALFVGRLEDVKGVGVLLDAARLSAGRIETIVVGSGPLEDDVQAAADAGLVTYLGRREWPEIAGLMDSACAVVVPSIWEENCPMVVLEAGARGCPVVASSLGGLIELIDDGEDGLLVPASDAAALAEAMTRLAGDQDLTGRLGAARHARTVANNTPRAHLHALMSAYEHATAVSRSRPARQRA